MVRVLVVDLDGPARELILKTLSQQRRLRVSGCAEDLLMAITLSRGSDIILASTTLPDDGAYQLIKALSQYDICTPVLIIGSKEQPTEIIRFFEAGARGFISRKAGSNKLVDSILRIYNGEILFNQHWLPALLSRLHEMSEKMDEFKHLFGVEVKLTRREREILHLLSRDYTNQDIANQLIIEVGTVKNHVHNILSKLNVNSRSEAAAIVHVVSNRQRAYQQLSPRYTQHENYLP